jgi:hypothetical protein
MPLIADEAHSTIACRTAERMNCPRIYAFSATSHAESLMKNPTPIHEITVDSDVVVDHVPVCDIKYTTAIEKVAIMEIMKSHQKVVIFVPNDLIYRTQATISSIYETMPVFKFVSSLKVVDKLKKQSGKAIMVAPYGSSKVGVNFCGDAALLLESERMSSQQIHQIISRMLRITNNAKNVDVVLAYPGESKLFARFKIALVNLTRYHTMPKISNYTATRKLDSGVVQYILTKLKQTDAEVSDVHYLSYIFPSSRTLSKLYETLGVTKADLSKVRALHAKFKKSKK